MLVVCNAAEGQRISLHGRAGVTGSTALVQDPVATPGLAVLLGSPIDAEVRVVAVPAPTVGGGVGVSFWPAVVLTGDVEWTATQLRAEDSGGRRTMQDLNVLHTSFGLNWAARPSIELGGAAGLIWYRTEETGLFRGGSDTSPTVEVRLAWVPPVLARRLAVTGAAHTHRFGTAAIRDAGGTDGDVARVSLGVRFRFLEVGL